MSDNNATPIAIRRNADYANIDEAIADYESAPDSQAELIAWHTLIDMLEEWIVEEAPATKDILQFHDVACGTQVMISFGKEVVVTWSDDSGENRIIVSDEALDEIQEVTHSVGLWGHRFLLDTWEN